MTAVYVIAAEGGPVKIGIASKPESRLRQLATGTPFRLRLAHVEDVGAVGAREIEQAAHALLKAARVNGEWFAVTVEEARAAVLQAVASFQRRSFAERPDITAAQLRAARSLLGWSQQQLATAAAVGVATVRRFEGPAAIVPGALHLRALRRAVEDAGVEILEAPGGGVGVMLRGKS